MTTKKNPQISNEAIHTLLLAKKYYSAIKLPFCAYGKLPLDSNVVISCKHTYGYICYNACAYLKLALTIKYYNKYITCPDIYD